MTMQVMQVQNKDCITKRRENQNSPEQRVCRPSEKKSSTNEAIGQVHRGGVD